MKTDQFPSQSLLPCIDFHPCMAIVQNEENTTIR
ncbi:unnamed protein product, partial [Rotaria sp. Silwood1]